MALLCSGASVSPVVTCQGWMDGVVRKAARGKPSLFLPMMAGMNLFVCIPALPPRAVFSIKLSTVLLVDLHPLNFVL
jgi:hypothetical protein